MSRRNVVALAGFAMSPMVRRPSEPLGITAIRTARAAIADAGLRLADIDGFVSSSLLPSSGGLAARDGETVVSSNWLSERMKAGPAFVAGFQGNGQLTGSLALAVQAIASGAVRHVLFHRALHNPPEGSYNDNPMTRAAGDLQYTAPLGFHGALPAIAMVANEYAHRYGARRETLAKIVVEARRNGARLPWSVWHGKPLAEEAWLAEPQVCEPLTRLDCDMPVQGCGAFVLTSAERARDMPHRPVLVSGIATGNPRQLRLPLHWTLDEFEESGQALAGRLWAESGLSPSEVDLPQLYDGFSPLIYLWLEALGFCPRGEAHRLVAAGGIESDRAGALPVLSGGGVLGNGRLHGLPQLLEVYLQLSGRAGARQRRARTGLISYSLPSFGGAAAFSNEAF